MDFTKKYCCIERKKNDFAICWTKEIYYQDENGLHPITTADCEVTTFYILDNARKPVAIENLKECSGNVFILFI